ncbi:MAG TPA: phosphotransferase [Syntrophorhabdaceae bacterium]|jgi:hypothetical protein
MSLAGEFIIDFAREALGLDRPLPIEGAPLSARGSDRTFYRITWGEGKSCILVHYNPVRTENGYYAEITQFLAAIGVPAPRLIAHDPGQCLLLMEDMGERDLWYYREDLWEGRRDLYVKTLEAVHCLHSFDIEDFPRYGVRLMERFGPELYQWEREYFKEHFMQGSLGLTIEPSCAKRLEGELAGLAKRLSDTRQCLVHRDLQSQNIMIRDRMPFLIDYQGMRFGSPFYDLASLLCDPYVRFSFTEIEDLLLVYYGMGNKEMEWDVFQGLFWDASAQRLMQALGAYGFLGYKKGLTSFLGHIPAALANLDMAAAKAVSLPCLRELTGKCLKKWGSMHSLS